jgi:hypothetical protein
MRRATVAIVLVLFWSLAAAQTDSTSSVADHELFVFSYPGGWVHKPNVNAVEIIGSDGEVLLVSAHRLRPLDPASIQKRFEALERSMPGLMEKQTAAEGYRPVEPTSAVRVNDGLTVVRLRHVAEKPDGKSSVFVYAHLQHLRYALLTLSFSNKSAKEAQLQADGLADGFKWKR